jgi:hypothetical protein
MNYLDYFEKTKLNDDKNYLKKINEITKNLKLPKSIVGLLEVTNGGYLYDKNSAFLIKNIDNQDIIVSGVHFENIFFIDYYYFENRNNYEPCHFENINSLILIGRAAFREYLFIGVDKDNFGKIYFAPDDNIFDFITEDNDSLIYPTIEVAPDLDSFLLMLRNPEDLEKEINETD